MSIRQARPGDAAALAEVLVDCVAGGASVSFMAPLSAARALAFWEDALAAAARGERVVLLAETVEDAGGASVPGDPRVVGTVQLVPALPENQPHRGDIAKLLVHRSARRRGVGGALMRAAESAARAAGLTLLVLDTVTGGDGERLYAGLGWERVGVVPGYALWPEGGLCDTTVFYRALA